MKKSNQKIIKEYLLLCIPFIIYAVYKNGYLVYQKNLVNIYLVFKPLYLVLISVFIKWIIDIIKNKSIKFKFDNNLIYVVLLSMIMPYNINLLIYAISFTILYLLTNVLRKYIKFNEVAFMYLILIFLCLITNNLEYASPMELNYEYNFSIIDNLFGRNIGGISNTSIILSILSFIYLSSTLYYKKEIPISLNITYLILAIIYYFIFHDNYILNSEVIFASIFVSVIPSITPFKDKYNYVYGIILGIITFILTILVSPIVSIYIAMFIVSLFMNTHFKSKASVN